MRGLFILLILGCLLFGEKVLYSQSYPFREYTVMDGLPQSQSSGIFQDSRGYLWISTRNGVSRFDGIEFRNYFKNDGLPSNYINQIFEDYNGYIYALSSRGLSKFDGLKFTYFPPPGDSYSFSFSSGTPTGIADNFLLINFDPVDSISGLVNFKDGVYSDYSGSFTALDTLDIENYFFKTNNNELLLLDKKGRALSWKNNRLTQISEKKFNSISVEQDQIVFTSDDKAFEYANGSLKLLNQKKSGISEIRIISRSEMNNYLDLIIDRSEFLIKLPFGNATNHIIDHEGNIWIATEKNLYRLISTAFSKIGIADGLANSIWALSQDKNGHLWFGSLYGDLQEYDGKEFRLRNEYKTFFNRKTIGFYKGSSKMSNGDIFFSTNQGVLVWNGKSFSIIKGIPHDAQVCYIYEDIADKSVLFGTSRGLYYLKGGSMKIFPEFTDDYLGVIEGAVREDSGKCWLSGHKGLVLFDGAHFQQIRDSVIPQTYTYTIDKDSRGGLWVTSEEGLYFKYKDSKSFIHAIPESINKPANSLIVMDSSSVLVGRTTDICIIDLKKFYSKNPDYYKIYDKSDGFSGNDCLDNGIIKNRDGKYMILTSEGVDILDPRKLKTNRFRPETYITGVDYKTDSLTWEPINEPQLFYSKNGEINLNRKQNTVRISFIGISTTNPEKVNYQYRLSGYEEVWSSLGHGRKAVYENLPPGRYTFQVKSFNADGIGIKEPRAVNIIIKPAFWQTLMYKILIVVLTIIISVLITWVIMKYRHKIKREQEKLHSELSHLQIGSVIKQFDPHFTFNVLSSVGSLIMKGKKEEAYDYLLKLSALLRTVLNDGSLIIKPLEEELAFVKSYCEVQKLRFGDRFNWNITVNENVNMLQEIPKLTIQTFVENSIKHGLESRREGGRVDINLSNISSGLEITVIDNGIGRVAARQQNTGGTGNGIKIITGLFDQMNRNNKNKTTIELVDLYGVGSHPSGTEVKIFIPGDYLFGFNKFN